MRKLFIILIALFALNSYAKDFTNADIEAILKENIQTKAILAEAGLFLDLKANSIKLLDSDKFMSVCDAVVFSDDEFEAMSADLAVKNKIPAKDDTKKQDDYGAKNDFREATKGDLSERKKSFWDSVIY